MRCRLGISSFVAVLCFATASAQAQWDVAADFDINNNPGAMVAGGQWSYGQLPYVDGTPDPNGFVLYDEAGTVVDPNAPFAWQDLSAPSVDTLGAVSYNESTEFKSFFGIDWEPMEVNLVPDQSKAVASTAKLTVPATGMYEVHAEFADNQDCCAGRESDAWVLSDADSVLFNVSPLPASDGMLTHQTGTQREFVVYDGVVNLAEGESLYFASGALGPGGDHAVLRATVNLVPEPSSLSLTAFGILVMFSWSRGRRKR